jgi:hypothetical protein
MKTNIAPFIRLGEGIHPVLDFELLRQHYPSFPEEVGCITSASDLIGWETLRERYSIKDSSAVPCDLFVWGTGAPPDPRLTRVGGVPFLPKRYQWPEIDGVVTSFLCQFNFQDSKDLFGQRVARKLPGDILLVFVADDFSFFEKELMRFVWLSAEENDVITQEDVPVPTNSFEFVQAWGARYRTKDIPSKWKKAYAIPDEVAGGKCYSLPVLRGTKIGGVPCDSQQNMNKAPKGFLCQLVSIQASQDTEWPWIDREQPITEFFGNDGLYSKKNELMIGDMGELSLYLDEDGSISIGGSCG